MPAARFQRTKKLWTGETNLTAGKVSVRTEFVADPCAKCAVEPPLWTLSNFACVTMLERAGRRCFHDVHA
ncbi:hypothetical protein AXG53_16515 [Stenotrophomonas sp. KCTC 12332]|nr:hypothetical protein AXG53_16515 [Stenotrophomonas sp. KCTC 12332]